jgi:thiamine pyrophosphate-dependent acetolactate synthase large subunit-like protein
MEAEPEYGIEPQPTDFAAFARSYGAAGFTIERPADAESIVHGLQGLAALPRASYVDC